MFFCKAGLEIGEMILAVNKDSLLGSNYDTVNIHSFLFAWSFSGVTFSLLFAVVSVRASSWCVVYPL